MSINLKQELHRHFGYDHFRPGQREAITHILNKKNTLVVMPTGAGKSMCYQLPALLNSKTTVVVSPLIALMKDQVEFLQSAGKEATFINSSLNSSEQARRLHAMHEGRFQLVYVAPERFRSAAFLSHLRGVAINLFVVDEAHCISHWGHDFRPDYLTLKHVISQLQNPTVAALTATATLKVQEDIIHQLGLLRCEKVITGFNRPNLSFEVEYTPDDAAKLEVLEKLLKGTNESVIIYTGTRREAEEVADFMRLVCKRKTDFYHAGLEATERSRIQDAFMNDQSSVIVATNAFGMGVNKSDIRYVIHYNLPSNLEAYYQEAGRAGRDGKHARCILLYAPQDRALQEWFIENDAPSKEELQNLYELIKAASEDGLARINLGYLQRMTGLHETKVRVGIAEMVKARALRELGDEYGMMYFEITPVRNLDFSPNFREIKARRKNKLQQLQQMIHFAEGNACRRRFILQHFGDTGSAEAAWCCDNCQLRASTPVEKPATKDDYTEAEKTALIILHAVKHLKREVGRSRLVEILTGSKAQSIFEFGWHKTKHYRRLQHFTQSQCRDCIDQILKARYLKLIGSDYPILKLTPKGEEALRQLASIPLNFKNAPTPAPEGSPLQKIGQLTDTLQQTLLLFRQGRSVAEIAERRNLSVGTIFTHFNRLIAMDLVKVTAVVSVDKVQRIRAVIKEKGFSSLTPIKECLSDDFSYDEIRCVVADEARKLKSESSAPGNGNHNFDSELFESLKNFRFQLAKNEHLPAFVFFHDSVLQSLATIKPQSIAALSEIKGLGEIKILKYGKQILDLIQNRPAAIPPENGMNFNADFKKDAIGKFLSQIHPKHLKGPWKSGYALDFNSRFSGSLWQRTEIGELVYRFKYNEELYLAIVLVNKLTEFMDSHPEFKSVDGVLAIPPSKHRVTDPMSLIAEGVSDKIQVPYLKDTLLKKRPTRLQKEMTNLVQKKYNVEGAFTVKKSIQNRKLLLLDDLYDSGATLNEAVLTLQRAGANALYVLTLTKTIHANN